MSEHPAADMVSAMALLLKAVAIASRSEGDPGRALRAIRTALDDLDRHLMADDWRTLARTAGWLTQQARRERG